MKKTIRVHSVDFNKKHVFEGGFFDSILKKKYNVVYDEKSPDFLFCGCFSNTHLAYNCVKIFYTGENITPDFNLFDYAIGFDHLSYEDRYFRLPFFRWFLSEEDLRIKDMEFFRNALAQKTDFCDFIYSNSSRSSLQRDEIFDVLSRYKKVNAGGGCRNNIGKRVADKLAWQKAHKFSIAFENSSKSGYTTEKLFDALKADTIPIYWGNPRVADDVNPKRIINCHDYASFEEVLAVVRQLDQDDESYLDMLSQPWFDKDVPDLMKDDQKFIEWFYHIFDQTTEQACRTTQYGWTALYLKWHRRQSLYRMMRDSKYYRGFFHKVKIVRKRCYKIIGKI